MIQVKPTKSRNFTTGTFIRSCKVDNFSKFCSNCTVFHTIEFWGFSSNLNLKQVLLLRYPLLPWLYLEGVYTWSFIPWWNLSQDDISPVYGELSLTIYMFLQRYNFNPKLNSSLSKGQGWNFIQGWKEEKKTCKHFMPG